MKLSSADTLCLKFETVTRSYATPFLCVMSMPINNPTVFACATEQIAISPIEINNFKLNKTNSKVPIRKSDTSRFGAPESNNER